ncbi:DNA polymerase beta superfamily protein [Streptomyces sp. NBRC 110611]|uniref:nucleotidyltransferase domain-containing protein n=1 Tax=Streptomyces sp. NBRC 110611 TaxID=1621259 RepID=UPI00099F9390|nr:nucleotidyltransferase domain-containing protein [Streptomyces sp. NBRC 110611]
MPENTPENTPETTRRDAVLRAAGLPAVDLGAVVAEQDDPLIFATVSGAHLYGFPSRDSDVDLRGAHLLPAAALVGLHEPEETRTRMWDRDRVEMDLVSHDLRKFARLLLRRNGYVLEQLLSPLVVHTTDVHRELIALAPGLLTAHHAHHYRGFATTQWRLFEKTGELKPLLYTLRVLLTGIHLMASGRLRAHLPTLAEEVAAPPYVAELIAAKEEAEHGLAGEVVDPARLRTDIEALHARLDAAQAATALPDAPAGRDALHDLIVRARLDGFPAPAPASPRCPGI